MAKENIIEKLRTGDTSELLENLRKNQERIKAESLSKNIPSGETISQFRPGTSLTDQSLVSAWKDIKNFEMKDFLPSQRFKEDTNLIKSGFSALKEKVSGLLGTKDLTSSQILKDRIKLAGESKLDIEKREGKIVTEKDILAGIIKKPSKVVPFLRGAVEAKDFAPLLLAAGKIEAGTATVDDVTKIKDYYDEQDKLSKAFKTPGYKIASIIEQAPSFMGELYLTRGISTFGKKAAMEAGEKFLKKILKKGGKEFLEKALKEATERTVKQKVAGFGLKSAGTIAGEALRTPFSGITRIPAETIKKMLPKQIDTGSEDLNKIIVQKGDNAFDAFKKATGEAFIENVSERSGALFSGVKLPKSVKDKIVKSSFVKAFLKKNPLADTSALKTIWKKAGWNGIVGEFGEERIGQVGHALFEKVGLSDQEFQFPTLEDMAIELTAFSIMGTGMKAIEFSVGKPAGMSIKDVSGEEASKIARENIEKSDKEYAEWLNNNPKAVKEVDGIVNVSKTILGKENKAKFLKESKEKFDRKYKNIYSNEKHKTISEGTDNIIKDVSEIDPDFKAIAEQSKKMGLSKYQFIAEYNKEMTNQNLSKRDGALAIDKLMKEDLKMTPEEFYDNYVTDTKKEPEKELADNLIEEVSEESINDDSVREFASSKKPMSFIEDYLEKNKLPLTSFDSVRTGFENKAKLLKDDKGFIFYSPNIEENLSIEDAIKEVQSGRHANIKSRASDVDKKLSLTPSTYDAIGTWADGAENSVWQEYDNINADTLKYNGALKGKLSNQKAILTFSENENGTDSLYFVDINNKDLTTKELSDIMEEQGIENKTIRKTDNGYQVSIFDEGSKEESKLINLNKKYGYKIEKYRGQGNFLGSWETRAEGLKAYNEVISEREVRRDKGRDKEEQQKGLVVPSRVAPQVDLAKKIDKTLSPISPQGIIKGRKDVLVKRRIREQAKGARAGLIEGKKIEGAKQKLISAEKIGEIRREGSLARLKQRTIDRQRATTDKLKTELKTASTIKKLKEKEKAGNTVRTWIRSYINRNYVGQKKKELISSIFTDSFLKTTNFSTINKAIDKLDKQSLKITKKSLRATIYKKLKSTKTKLKFGKPSGKFTPDIQYALDVYREAIGMTEQGAAEKIADNLERGTKNPFGNVAVENVIISKASDIGQKTVKEKEAGAKEKSKEELKGILDDINSLIEEGKLSRDLESFNRATDIQRTNERIIEVITGGKGIDPKTKTLGVQQSDKLFDKARRVLFTAGLSQMGMQDVANILSSKDKDTKEGRGVINKAFYTLPEYNKYNQGTKIKSNKIRESIKDAYSFEKEKEIDNKILENSEKVFLGSFENAKGEDIPLDMSRDEAMKLYAIIQNKKLKEAVMHEDGMAYTEEMIDAVDSFLTEQDKALVKKVFEFNDGFYHEINEIFKKFSGVNLPYEKNYVPIRREAGDTAEDLPMINNVKQIYSVSKASLKERVENLNRIEIDGLIQSEIRHITEMQHYISYAEKVRELNSIFDNPDVKNAIKQEYGAKPLSTINSFRKDLARGGIDSGKKLKWVDKFMSNFSFAQLAVKPKQIATQITSLFSYADEIPAGEWGKGLAKFITNPVKYGKELYNLSTYLQNRGMNIDKDIQNMTRNDSYRLVKKKSSLKNTLMFNVRAGDKGAIIIGGYPIYNYHKKKALEAGKSEKEATAIGIEEFEKATDLTQQSAQIATLSEMQRMGSLGRLFVAFKSSPNLYVRKEIGALRALVAGKVTLRQFAKTIAIYHFVLPALYQFVADGFRWDEDEQKRAAIMGSLNGIFIVGDGLEYIIKKALNQKTWGLEDPLTGEIARIGDAVGEIMKDEEFNTDDILTVVKQLLDTGGKAGGIPSDAILKDIGAISTAKEGEYGKALMMLAGWSKFQANKKAESLDLKKKKKAREKGFKGVGIEGLTADDLDLDLLKDSKFDFGDFEDIKAEDLDLDLLEDSNFNFGDLENIKAEDLDLDLLN